MMQIKIYSVMLSCKLALKFARSNINTPEVVIDAGLGYIPTRASALL